MVLTRGSALVTMAWLIARADVWQASSMYSKHTGRESVEGVIDLPTDCQCPHSPRAASCPLVPSLITADPRVGSLASVLHVISSHLLSPSQSGGTLAASQAGYTLCLLSGPWRKLLPAPRLLSSVMWAKLVRPWLAAPLKSLAGVH